METQTDDALILAPLPSPLFFFCVRRHSSLYFLMVQGSHIAHAASLVLVTERVVHSNFAVSSFFLHVAILGHKR